MLKITKLKSIFITTIFVLCILRAAKSISRDEFEFYSIRRDSIEIGMEQINDGSNDRVLILILPKQILERLLININRKSQLCNFVEGLKRISDNIEVQILSISSNSIRYFAIETHVKEILMTYGWCDISRSARTIIFGYGMFGMNEYGYPTFTDATYTPFQTYMNPALTEFFRSIQNDNDDFNLDGTMVLGVPPRSGILRLPPWNHATEREIKKPAIHIYTINDEIREVEEGDYIPINQVNNYMPNGNDMNYRYINLSHQHYLFIMISISDLKRLLSPPKRPNLKPKRREFFEFVNEIVASTTDFDLGVKLWAWSGFRNGMTQRTMSVFVNQFLKAHKPANGVDLHSIITIFGFGKFDSLDYEYRRYRNYELTKFFINDTRGIDLRGATGVHV